MEPKKKKSVDWLRIIVWASAFAAIFGAGLVLYREIGREAEQALLYEAYEPADEILEERMPALSALAAAVPVKASPKPALPESKTQQQKIEIEFPTGVSLGLVYARDWTSTDEEDWKLVGPARGSIDWPLDQRVRFVAFRSRQLDLSQLEKFPAEGVHEIVLHGTGLDDDSAVHLLRFKSLDHLDLENTPIGDRGLEIVEQLASLRSLSLKSTRITDDGVARLKNLKQLQALDLRYIEAITNEGVRHVSEISALEHLRLGAAYNVTVDREMDSGAERVVRAVSEMRGDEYVYINDEGMANLPRLPNLKTLHLERIALKGDGLSALKEIPGLRELALISVLERAYGSKVSKEAVHELSGLSALEKLWVFSAEDLAVDVIEAASKIPALRSLIFSSPDHSYFATGLSTQTLPLLGKFDKLEELQIGTAYNEKLGGADWSGLAKMQNLKKLRLSGVYESQDASNAASAIGEIHSLEQLGFYHVALTNSGVQKLSKLEQITELAIIIPSYYGTKQPHALVTDNGLKSLAGMKNLRSLSLMGCDVSDYGLESIAALPELRQLDLRGTTFNMTRFTEVFGSRSWGEFKKWFKNYRHSGTENVAKASKLERLFVDKHLISPANIEELRRELPNCQILRGGHAW